ncbi:CDC50 family protein [Diaporthe amygdali]|uniref:CDC50 family protein n=1 Tax=Phomopsis amygdali TaxID=1214568 RepID=UPI0022FF2456|nr:CDC50 family protein [Diaporthe amygdali]KAJ0121460.1 CDC50 family protein [Diaporthe amygdali]
MLRHRTEKSPRTDKKSSKPKDTEFRQQRMKAWEPMLTPKICIKAFICLGLALIVVGIVWLATSEQTREISLDYTRCHEIDSYDELQVMPPENVSKHFKASSAGQPVDQWKRSNQTLTFDGVTKNYTLCTIEFFLPEDLQPPVFYYYRLANFHQNHRQYIKSRHVEQLKGSPSSLGSIKGSACAPLGTLEAEENTQESIIYPCGMIANSYFNDTFVAPLRLSSTDSSNQTRSYNMTTRGISTSIDKLLYQPSRYNITPETNSNDTIKIVPPPAWSERFPNGYHSGNLFNPAEDESFMVWMRTAAGSRFAKLAMRNDEDVMERGRYRLEAMSHFPVHLNKGTKSIIISTSSIVGRRNAFLGRGFVILGAFSFFAAFLSAITLKYTPRRLSDHDYLHRSNALLRM